MPEPRRAQPKQSTIDAAEVERFSALAAEWSGDQALALTGRPLAMSGRPLIG